jgi:hypothetical protein
MDVKRGISEDVYGMAPQRLRDMAKAGLPEPQSPVVEAVTLVGTTSIYPTPSVCLESRFFQTTP